MQIDIKLPCIYNASLWLRDDLQIHEKCKAYPLEYFSEWKLSSIEWKRKPTYLQSLCYFGGICHHRERWHLVGLQTRVAKCGKFNQGLVSRRSRKVFAPRQKAVAKFKTKSWQRCFIYIFLIWPRDPFTQEVSPRRIHLSVFRYSDSHWPKVFKVSILNPL